MTFTSRPATPEERAQGIGRVNTIHEICPYGIDRRITWADEYVPLSGTAILPTAFIPFQELRDPWIPGTPLPASVYLPMSPPPDTRPIAFRRDSARKVLDAWRADAERRPDYPHDDEDPHGR
jgi:hypothetical protein